jgi:hypothetical protein
MITTSKEIELASSDNWRLQPFNERTVSFPFAESKQN